MQNQLGSQKIIWQWGRPELMRKDWSRTKITGFRGCSVCCEGFGAPVMLKSSLPEMFGSVPWDLLKGSLKTGDAWCDAPE